MSCVDKNWDDIAKGRDGVSVRVVRKGQQPNQTRSNAPPRCCLWHLDMQEQTVTRMSLQALSLLNEKALSSAADTEGIEKRTQCNETLSNTEAAKTRPPHRPRKPKTASRATNTKPIENELHQSQSHALLQVNLKSKNMIRLHGDRSSLLNALIWATSRHIRIQSQAHPTRATNRNHDRSHARGPKN